jgi:hypothetical protein
MDFIISKTSDYYHEEPTCEGAIKKPFPVFHVRTCNEEEFNKKFAPREGLWKSKGFNHTTTEEGYIKRQEEDKEQWCISINSLDELMAFYEQHGQLIIKSNYLSGTPEIEIYNDYRE